MAQVEEIINFMRKEATRGITIELHQVKDRNHQGVAPPRGGFWIANVIQSSNEGVVIGHVGQGLVMEAKG